MKKQLWIAVTLLITIQTTAQTTYTLEQCKEFAIQNNLTFQTSKLDVEIASRQQREALTKYFPSINASGMAFNANKSTVIMDMDFSALGAGFISMPLIKNGKTVSVTVMQPIFAGGQIVNSNKLAHIGQEATEYQLQLTKDEITLNTEQYYWQLINLQEKLKTLNTIAKQLIQIRKDTEMAIQAGITNRNDLLRVELKQQELAGQQLKLENGINITTLALCQYIGINATNFTVTPVKFVIPESPATCYISPKEAVQQRTERLLLDKNVEASNLQKRIEIGKYLPSLGIGAGYIYHDFLEKDHSFAIGFAQVNIPISDWWGGSYSIKRQKLKQKQAELQRTNSLQLLEVQTEQTWNELQEAYKQILIANKSIESATENLRLNREYLHAGTVTIIDILDAETLLQKSHDSFTDAYTIYQLKYSKYLQITR